MLATRMKNLGYRSLLLAVGFLIIGPSSFSQKDSVINLSTIQKYLHVGNNISYLIDRTQKLQREDLSSASFEYPNRKFLFDIKNLKGNYFVKVVVTNDSPDSQTFHLYVGKGIDFSFFKFIY